VTLAAVLSQVRKQRVHRLESGRIDHRAALAPNRDEASLTQAIKMKGQRVRGYAKRLGNLAGRHTFGTCLNQHAKCIKAVLLRERS
jgi:hypothetical protein